MKFQASGPSGPESLQSQTRPWPKKRLSISCLGVVHRRLSAINIRDAAEIEPAVAAFARGSNASMVVLPGPETISHRELITTLAARHKLPTVYPYRYFVTNGGLICYGPDELQQHRQAAGYVDRILKGEKPADLPVQAPTKFELVINLKPRKRSASKSRRRFLPAPTR